MSPFPPFPPIFHSSNSPDYQRIVSLIKLLWSSPPPHPPELSLWNDYLSLSHRFDVPPTLFFSYLFHFHNLDLHSFFTKTEFTFQPRSYRTSSDLVEAPSKHFNHQLKNSLRDRPLPPSFFSYFNLFSHPSMSHPSLNSHILSQESSLLTFINISRSYFPSFSFIENFHPPSLKTFYFYDNQFSSFSPLSLPNLSSLDLSHNHLLDLQGIHLLNLPNLKSLYLVNNRISSINLLHTLNSPLLEHISLFDNPLLVSSFIQDLSLCSFPHLKTLRLPKYLQKFSPTLHSLFPSLTEIDFI